MTPQQIYDRIHGDIAMLSSVFMEQRRFGAAGTLANVARLLVSSNGHIPIDHQVAEMSEPDYVPTLFTEGVSE